MIQLSRLFQSFCHAMRGLKIIFQSEQSFRIQVFAACVVGIFLFMFPLSRSQTVVILFLMAFVLILEMINSIFERLVDAFKPRIHPVVGEIKDIMAATVLVASVVAACIGLVIFGPHFFRLFLS
ncbi:MAG: Undecaprenol kinase [Candidatus Uhrbacteria bacterium GW2011_GWF2_41_16]|jgi:diacylglycerol kinase|uniref:Undecaprenol kinase n=2 Tax=Candidatus Uhriibacteriota TaxID=1752732 RepID=A0A0G0VD09_9BACT|nr:MAG: Undecaprenol kinase [Candidatus Uhrbacteria bacterium GW2011_GWA2_41_10]KKR87830.1 MAG: Undecaprenol kinase [Candidatus Uhrbacteria bacterium GW2011_GWC2_41_11]KKR98769.1 MAG: Undecaprenol kinase [Candidatus Uhrbacteria bacterium GW2011_GWF2_41_16]HBP00113.1 diacylglycerol kinase [Candidatus Uhrbacteria bacterium]